MGAVVRFPQERRKLWLDQPARGPAVVIVLPVVRVERFDLPPLLDPATYLRIGESFEALWLALNWPG